MNKDENLNRFGMVGQTSELGVGLGSARVTSGGPYDPIQAAEDGFGSPEASESEDGSSQRVMIACAWWVSRGFGDPIWDSYTQSSLSLS